MLVLMFVLRGLRLACELVTYFGCVWIKTCGLELCSSVDMMCFCDEWMRYYVCYELCSDCVYFVMKCGEIQK